MTAGVRRVEGEGLRVDAFDGMRGVWVVAFLMRHMLMNLPRGEPIWVVTSAFSNAIEMFFVLSGFLITGLLYDSKGRPGFFRNYLARRSLRIFPLYYVVLIILFVVLPLLPFGKPAEFDVLVRNQAWYWTYTTNFLIAITGGSGTPLNTGHFWSLAVEEQFYLVWPFLIFVLNRRGIIRLCWACIAGAILFRLGLHLWNDANGVYVLTPGRIDSLAIGGLLAIHVRDPGGLPALVRKLRGPSWLALMGMLAIIIQEGELSRRGVSNYLAGYTLSSLVHGYYLMWMAANPSVAITRWVSHPAWTLVGRHSYAIYIFHFPVIGLLVRLVDPQYVISRTPDSIIPVWLIYSAVAFALSFGLAMLAWVSFERRFLRLKRFFPSPPAMPALPVP